MRQIKFRVWNVETKQMNYQGSNTTKDNQVMDCCINFDDSGSRVLIRYTKDQLCEEISNFRIMQSTSLIDRNRKEIFEGDIIRWTNVFGVKEFALYRDEFITVVKWLNGGLVIEDGEITYDMSASKNIEIIGNIYENPELIKLSKS